MKDRIIYIVGNAALMLGYIALAVGIVIAIAAS